MRNHKRIIAELMHDVGYNRDEIYKYLQISSDPIIDELVKRPRQYGARKTFTELREFFERRSI